MAADYEDKLLRISAKLVTAQNRAQLESALARADSKWREEEFKLIRFEIIKNIDGEPAADEFVNKNLQFPKLREIAFNRAVDCQNFGEAEQLCIDAVSECKQHQGVSPWLYKLYCVYELMGDTEKLAATAQRILLCGKLEYYDKLKTLLHEQGIWDSSYSELLRKCESKLSYMQYMEILAKEGEYDSLLAYLKKHGEMVYNYGKLLAKKYPLDVSGLFTGQINKDAEAAYGRESYSNICSKILLYAQAGYKTEAADMIGAFKLKYKRKPAFVNELGKIEI